MLNDWVEQFFHKTIFYLCSGFVQLDKVVSFVENRSKYVKKCKGCDFRKAVEQMDEYISNNVVCVRII